MDDEERREEAIWRATVLGPLVSARLEHGDVRRLCEEAAARVLEMLFRATHGVPRVASKLLRARSKAGTTRTRRKAKGDAYP